MNGSVRKVCGNDQENYNDYSIKNEKTCPSNLTVSILLIIKKVN